jgi:hypothetical protein
MLTSYHCFKVTTKLITSSSAFSGRESVVDYTQVDGIIDVESDDSNDKDDSQTVFPSGVEYKLKMVPDLSTRELSFSRAVVH